MSSGCPCHLDGGSAFSPSGLLEETLQALCARFSRSQNEDVVPLLIFSREPVLNLLQVAKKESEKGLSRDSWSRLQVHVLLVFTYE